MNPQNVPQKRNKFAPATHKTDTFSNFCCPVRMHFENYAHMNIIIFRNCRAHLRLLRLEGIKNPHLCRYRGIQILRGTNPSCYNSRVANGSLNAYLKHGHHLVKGWLSPEPLTPSSSYLSSSAPPI